MLFHFYVLIISVVFINSLQTKCNEKFCLTADWLLINNTNAHQASRKCSNGWLVEVTDNDVELLLESLLSEGDKNKIFYKLLLNMRKDPNSWTWNNKNSVSDRIAHQEGNPPPTVACLTSSSYKTFEYYASLMNEMKYFICSKKVSTEQECTNLNSIFISGTCYYAGKQQVTWYEANNICIASNATLAIFDNNNIQTIDSTSVNSLFTSNNEEYWIGMSRQTLKWIHSDSIVTFNKWADGSPSQDSTNDCSYFHLISGRGFPWETGSCSGPFTVVCMSDFTSTTMASTTLPFSTTSTTTSRTLLTPTSSTTSINSTTTATSNLPSNASTHSSYESNNNSLSNGAKIGIGIGVGISCLLILIVVISIIKFYGYPRLKKAKPDKPTSRIESTTQTSFYASDDYSMLNLEDAKLEARTRTYERLENSA